MGITVNALALELIIANGDSTDDPGRVTMVEGFVNDALDEVAVATEWNSFRARAPINTVIDQEEYQLPIGGREIIQLRYTDNGQPIQHWTVQEAANRSVQLEEADRANIWIEDGNIIDAGNVLYQFRLSPVPNSVLEFEANYYYHPSAIASGSTLPIPDHLIVFVKDRTKQYLLERDQKYQAATLLARRCEKNLETLVKREKRKIAANTQLQPVIINRSRRPIVLFDPNHYRNY